MRFPPPSAHLPLFSPFPFFFVYQKTLMGGKTSKWSVAILDDMQQSMLWESNALLLLGGMKEGRAHQVQQERERERERERKNEGLY